MTEKWVAPKSKMIEGWTMRCLLNHTCDQNEELRNWNWKINLDAETFSINAILPELQQTQKEFIKALKMYSRLNIEHHEEREDKDGKTRSTLDWKGGLLDPKQFHQKEQHCFLHVIHMKSWCFSMQEFLQDELVSKNMESDKRARTALKRKEKPRNGSHTWIVSWTSGICFSGRPILLALCSQPQMWEHWNYRM